MRLRLGTFNVWGLPEIFDVADDVSSRMRLISERLAESDLDLLLIQEAWTAEVRDTLRAGAEAAGFSVVEHPSGSGGLMTLSRLPVLAAQFERFHFRGDPERIDLGEYLGGKGFQTLRVQDRDRTLTVVNTHLHARYSRARPRLNSAVRTAQLLQIVGRVRDVSETLIVGGDLNCAKGDPEYEIFRSLLRMSELGGGTHHPTVSRTNWYKRDRRGRDKRIDFLFLRPEAGLAWETKDARLLFAEPARIRAIDRSLSDHYGFQATVALASRTSWLASRPLSDQAAAIERARELLDLAGAEADRRERVHFQTAGLWTTAAVAAAFLRRTDPVDRRRFLRAGIDVLTVGALAPAVGLGTLARLDSDDKRDAFEEARRVLAGLREEVSRSA